MLLITGRVGAIEDILLENLRGLGAHAAQNAQLGFSLKIHGDSSQFSGVLLYLLKRIM